MPRSLNAHEREILSGAIEDLKYIDSADERVQYLLKVLMGDLKWSEDDAIELASFIIYENRSHDPFKLVPTDWDRAVLLAGAWI